MSFVIAAPEFVTAAAARELVAWCLSRLAYYKAPGYVAFVDALGLTGAEVRATPRDVRRLIRCSGRRTWKF